MSNLTDWGLEPDYVDPSKIGVYLKLTANQKCVVRIVGTFNEKKLAVRGWEGWINQQDNFGEEVRRPQRVGINEKAVLQQAGAEDIKFFWALAVYNRTLGAIQCWQINQVSNRERIEDLVDTYGSPREFDIMIKRKGDGILTKYTLEKVESSAADAATAYSALEKSTIDLRQIFVGGDIMTPLEEKASDGDSIKPSRASRDGLMPIELVRNQIEAAQSFEQFDEALMLKDTYVKRGDISKAEQMTLKSIEAKVKERLSDEEVA
tara:strand:- start:3912 stop:4700 length:789 start_codon:yes stop_codon:yes gene_type:complete